MEYIDIFSKMLLSFAPFDPQGVFRNQNITPMGNVPKYELGYGNSVFLHSELMARNDHDDKCFCLNCKTAGFARTTWNGRIYEKLYANGVFPVFVEGIKEECIGYFWTYGERKIIDTDGNEWQEWKQSGLICLKDDEHGRRSALGNYDNRWCGFYEPQIWPFD